MNDIQMIAIDLDGTLVQTDGHVLPETVSVLHKVYEKGIIIAIASGRYPENAGLTFIDNGLTGPVIGLNGGIIQDKPMGQTLFLHLMADKTAREAIRCLDRMGAKYIIFSHKSVITSHVGMTHRSEINDGPRLERLGIVFSHGPEAVAKGLEKGITKLFIPEQPNLDRLREALSEIPHMLITRSGVCNIELMPEGIHKGHGITELAKWLGIPLSKVMAFGDEENDLPVLTGIGFGVAMGNAPDHVKAQCCFVTEAYDKNGVGRAIERFILSKENA